MKEEYDADVSTVTNGDTSKIEVEEVAVKMEAVVEQEEPMEAENEEEMPQVSPYELFNHDYKIKLTIFKIYSYVKDNNI